MKESFCCWAVNKKGQAYNYQNYQNYQNPQIRQKWCCLEVHWKSPPFCPVHLVELPDLHAWSAASQFSVRRCTWIAPEPCFFEARTGELPTKTVLFKRVTPRNLTWIYQKWPYLKGSNHLFQGPSFWISLVFGGWSLSDQGGEEDRLSNCPEATRIFSLAADGIPSMLHNPGTLPKGIGCIEKFGDGRLSSCDGSAPCCHDVLFIFSIYRLEL